MTCYIAVADEDMPGQVGDWSGLCMECARPVRATLPAPVGATVRCSSCLTLVGPVTLGVDLATGPDVTAYAVTNSAGECIASGDYAMLSDFDRDLLFGSGHAIGGLLGYLSGASSPTPPGTMTRQRRRAEARAQAKNA